MNGVVLAFALALIAGGCGASRRGSAKVEATDFLAGTYAVQMCASPCAPGDTATATQLGILVLDTVAMSFADLSAAELREFPVRLFGEPNPATRLCFTLRGGPAATRAWPNGVRVERSDWIAVTEPLQTDSAWIEFPLYESPDAGYRVRARGGSGRLDGTGHAWTAGPDGVRYSEYFVGRRIGPPQPERCVDALREQIRTAPERERALRVDEDTPYSLPRTFSASVRALGELGIPVSYADSGAGRITTAARTTVTARGDTGPVILVFPDTVVLELSLQRSGPGQTRVTLVVRSLLEGDERPAIDTQVERLRLAAVLMVRIRELLEMQRRS